MIVPRSRRSRHLDPTACRLDWAALIGCQRPAGIATPNMIATARSETSPPAIAETCHRFARLPRPRQGPCVWRGRSLRRRHSRGERGRMEIPAPQQDRQRAADQDRPERRRQRFERHRTGDVSETARDRLARKSVRATANAAGERHRCDLLHARDDDAQPDRLVRGHQCVRERQHHVAAREDPPRLVSRSPTTTASPPSPPGAAASWRGKRRSAAARSATPPLFRRRERSWAAPVQHPRGQRSDRAPPHISVRQPRTWRPGGVRPVCRKRTDHSAR